MKFILLGFNMRFFFAICFFLVFNRGLGQQIPSGPDTINSCASRELFYPGLSDIPEQGRASFLVAISYFPELTNARIQLKYKKIRTTLNVRPTLGSLVFNRKGSRKYIIRINNSLRDSIITMNELSPDAQVGLLGHELSHIVDYRGRSIWGVMGRGFGYLSKRGKARYEREVDAITINHGLGRQLYQWSNYVLHDSKASYRYKQFKSSIYMKPEEIQNTFTSGQP